MALPVTESDIELTTPQLLTVNTTAVLSASRLGKSKRSFFSIIPITAGETVTIVFGDSEPVLSQGIPLIKNQVFAQSLDTNGKGVFQGTIKAIATANSQVAFVEMFE